MPGIRRHCEGVGGAGWGVSSGILSKSCARLSYLWCIAAISNGLGDGHTQAQIQAPNSGFPKIRGTISGAP